jgi:hypothetical protein
MDERDSQDAKKIQQSEPFHAFVNAIRIGLPDGEIRISYFNFTDSIWHYLQFVMVCSPLFDNGIEVDILQS